MHALALARRYDAALHTKHVLHMIHTRQVTTRIIEGKGVLVLVELACPPRLRSEAKYLNLQIFPTYSYPMVTTASSSHP